MEILLTGGNGMVGRNIFGHFGTKKFGILLPANKELNLLNTQQVRNYLAEHRPKIVIHSIRIVGGHTKLPH